MSSKLYFSNKTDTPNLNLLVELAFSITNYGYNLDGFTNENYDIVITFLNDNYEGTIKLENGGNLSIEMNDPEQCIKLYNNLKNITL